MYELGFNADVESEKSLGKKSPGPPNRMNDLPYKEWMKYQKSFFRVSKAQETYREAIEFFTKEQWEDGTPSQTLLIALDTTQEFTFSSSKRIVHRKQGIGTGYALLNLLDEYIAQNSVFDFIIIDFNTWSDQKEVDNLIKAQSQVLSTSIRKLLIDKRYCLFLVDQAPSSTRCWEFSVALRGPLLLRDEKIGLRGPQDSILYTLILQAADDERTQQELPSNKPFTNKKMNFPTWIIPKVKPRKKNEILHPAKFPEPLIEDFIKLFSKKGDTIIDPMAGTGSTVIAALECHRNGYGIELMEEFAHIASSRVKDAMSISTLFDDPTKANTGKIIRGNSSRLKDLVELNNLTFNYSVTSPPYWSMLSNKGSENQKKRRDQNLKLTYSEDNPDDLGNIHDYDQFVDTLVDIYNTLSEKLAPGSILTIIVKNIKREHVVYPLAWDLTFRLCKEGGKYTYMGNTMWCQDDVGLKPFAVGIHWVSNTLHQYCLHLKKA
ncbi:MAG: site-specific DNA-methyltransferase [Puia sp.]|nr:site-specific DNA-methyltransferase [Puia sp.]